MVICNYWHYVMERYFFLLLKKNNIKNIYQKVFLYLPSATRAPWIELKYVVYVFEMVLRTRVICSDYII